MPPSVESPAHCPSATALLPTAPGLTPDFSQHSPHPHRQCGPPRWPGLALTFKSFYHPRCWLISEAPPWCSWQVRAPGPGTQCFFSPPPQALRNGEAGASTWARKVCQGGRGPVPTFMPFYTPMLCLARSHSLMYSSGLILMQPLWPNSNVTFSMKSPVPPGRDS